MPALAAALDARLVPALLGLGFNSAKGLRWQQDALEVRVVLDSKARDPFRGGAFTLEFEKSDDGQFEGKLAGRVRVDQLLDPGQRQQLLDLSNTIAARLQRPTGVSMGAIPESLRAEYLKAFNPRQELGPRPWMRFRDARDAEEWCTWLSAIMPGLVTRAESLDAHALLLGKTLSW